jgi:hypothetical protein
MDIRCLPNTLGGISPRAFYYSAPHHVSSSCSSLKSTIKYINDLFAFLIFFGFFCWALKFS